MRYPRLFSIDDRGVILVDMIVALALAAVFVTVISGSTAGLASAFERAQAKNSSLSMIDRSAQAFSSEKPFGNDQIEEETDGASLVRTRLAADGSIADAAGTPLCSVDFASHAVVGSYAYRSVQPMLSTSSVSITPISLPIDLGLPLTDLIVRGGVAYIAADSSKASDPDVLVIDIKDPSSAKVVSFIDTGPGMASIALAGDHVFGAAASAASQLHVMRLAGIDSLVLEKKYQLPLPFATATPARGSSISFDRNRVYLGTEKGDSEEISIIDASDPVSPRKMGGLETGSKVNDLIARGSALFVAASDQSQLRSVDVSDGAHPDLVAEFSPSGWSRQEGKSLSSFEGALGFGRTSGGFDIAADHELFLSGRSLNIPGGVYGIVQDRRRLFIATREVDKEFQIIDREGMFVEASYSLPVAPQKLTCDGDRLYVLAGTAPVIYEISFK